jgi:hypothetical protein
MTVLKPNKNAGVKLKTIQLTPDFVFHLNGLKPFFTTEAQAIRAALKLLYMERMGEVEVTRKGK